MLLSKINLHLLANQILELNRTQVYVISVNCKQNKKKN